MSVLHNLSAVAHQVATSWGRVSLEGGKTHRSVLVALEPRLRSRVRLGLRPPGLMGLATEVLLPEQTWSGRGQRGRGRERPHLETAWWRLKREG